MKVAIHRPGALGDVIMAAALCEPVRQRYGVAPDLLVHPTTLEILGPALSRMGIRILPDTGASRADYTLWFSLIGYPMEKPVRMDKHLLEYFAAELGVEYPSLPFLTGPRAVGSVSRYVTIQAKAAWSDLKNWPLDRWAELVRELQARGHCVLQIGGKDDPPIEGVDRSLLGEPFEACLMAQAFAVAHIGVDSVFNHTSAIRWPHRGGAPVPSVILFGPTSPTGFGYPHNQNLFAALPCQPVCNLGNSGCKHSTYRACMDALSQQAVLGALERLLRVESEPRLPVSVVMICKNEEACIATALRSAREADEIVVLDTGSTDGTLRILEEMKASELPQLRIHQCVWRDDYAWARNLALSHATHDWRIILDCDETITGGSMAEFRMAAAATTSRTLKWKVRAKGGDQWHRHIRSFRRGVLYVGEGHEVPDTDDGGECNAEIIYGYSPAHRLDPDRMLRILSAAHERRPDDTRTMYYLAREYLYKGRRNEAVAMFERYVSISQFRAERADAYLYLARLYFEAQRGDDARDACSRALQINANFREALQFMAEMSFPENAAAWRRYAELATNAGVLFVR